MNKMFLYILDQIQAKHENIKKDSMGLILKESLLISSRVHNYDRSWGVEAYRECQLD